MKVYETYNQDPSDILVKTNFALSFLFSVYIKETLEIDPKINLTALL